MSKITKTTFVVVADGLHGILFRNSDGSGGISLVEDRRFTPKNLSDDGPSGSRPEDQTPKQTDEATFAKQLVLALQQMHESHEFSELIIIADPQTLGQMRDAIPKSLKPAIIMSINKNLVQHSTSDIEKAIMDRVGT